MPVRHDIAELNVAGMRHAVRDSRVAGFFAAIERIDAAADAAPGLVWRMPEYLEEADAIEVRGPASGRGSGAPPSP